VVSKAILILTVTRCSELIFQLDPISTLHLHSSSNSKVHCLFYGREHSSLDHPGIDPY
jgi:hypothetical protein